VRHTPDWADLVRLPSLDLGIPPNEQVWNLFGPNAAQATIHHRPRLITRSLSALRSAAIAGAGIAQLPTMVVLDQAPHPRS
jgi:DNA-binding transcriptional LysR family regulator